MSHEFPTDDPRHCVTRIRFMVENVITHIKEDRTKVEDESALALLRDAEATLLELSTALETFTRRSTDR